MEDIPCSPSYPLKIASRCAKADSHIADIHCCCCCWCYLPQLCRCCSSNMAKA